MARCDRSLRIVWTLSLFVWMSMGGVGVAQTISTVAGGGMVDLGDGGPATQALLISPTGVYVDGAGDLYIADTGNDRIRKISARTGIITTIAGGGNPAATSGPAAIGDGGPATQARLQHPVALCMDDRGNMYIADTAYSFRVRKMGASGMMSTAAGGDPSMSEGAGDGKLATEAWMRPSGVYVDGAGDLYIADFGTNRVRKVDGKTRIIANFAGTGNTSFSGDGGPAVNASLWSPNSVMGDGAGNLYIADTGNLRIRKVDTWGTIATVAGNGEPGGSGDGGPATDARLRLIADSVDGAGPSGIFLDGAGNLYIADSGNHRIRKVDAETGIITTVVGNGKAGYSGDGGPATEASLKEPRDVFVDAVGNLYFSDTGNHCIRKVAAVLTLSLTAEPGAITADGTSAAVIQARISNAAGVLLTGDNTTVVAFEIADGEGSLSAAEGTAKGGIAETRLTSLSPGAVIVRASAPDIEGATVSVEVVLKEVPPEQVRASDFDGNGKVEFADFLAFVRHYGKKAGDADYDATFDLDDTQEIGFGDFLLFVQSYGRSVGEAD